jgi:cell division protein FtsQ
MKNYTNLLFTAGLGVYLFFALGFTGEKEREVLCSALHINIMDTLNSHFFTHAELEQLILGKENKILGYPVHDIELPALEDRLKNSPYIESAELYFTLEGTLHADIRQRVPIIRVMDSSGSSWYIDATGNVFPYKAGFTPHILVANGSIPGGNSLKGIRTMKELEETVGYTEWKELFNLASYIFKDTFWKSQIVQIYYSRSGDFELIPRVGAHQIIFGSADEMEEKFEKLKVFYHEGLSVKGWNHYDRINLKYKNQVICTKR